MNLPSPVSALSRRDFLKLSGLGMAGLFLPPLGDFRHLISDQQGRVIDPKISVYDVPSFNGQEIKAYWKDMVLPISEATVGEDETAYNRIWYRIAEEGYAYSGAIQPVKTQLNAVVTDIPNGGVLAEVTVPFTDAHWGPGQNFPFAYRFYYQTTYWVTGLERGAGGEAWYRIPDDKWEDFTYYVPASHLRLVPAEEITPLSPNVPAAARRLVVQTAEQVLIAYEWDRPVFMARIASGAKFSNGQYMTPPGKHITFHKRPYRHMAAGDIASNGYDLPGVPWITYFTEKGISFHGTYWHNDFGKPRSHGCVNLTPQAAKWIYRWTVPYVPPDQQFVYKDYGTSVEVI